MKRHAGLHALSQHHHFALIQALEMRRAGHAPSGRAAALRQVAEKFLRFWKKTGSQHFREEEEILLPAYLGQKQHAEDSGVQRLHAEHASLRAQIQELEASLERDLAPGELSRRLSELARASRPRPLRRERIVPSD
jgi:hemerythrin-like domain-containing protein